MRCIPDREEDTMSVSPLSAAALSCLLGRLTVLYHTAEENLPKLPDADSQASQSLTQVPGVCILLFLLDSSKQYGKDYEI